MLTARGKWKHGMAQWNLNGRFCFSLSLPTDAHRIPSACLYLRHQHRDQSQPLSTWKCCGRDSLGVPMFCIMNVLYNDYGRTRKHTFTLVTDICPPPFVPLTFHLCALLHHTQTGFMGPGSSEGSRTIFIILAMQCNFMQNMEWLNNSSQICFLT